MSVSYRGVIAALTAVAAFAATVPASAALVTTDLSASLANGPITISPLAGSSLTFSIIDPAFFALNPVGVATSNAEILSLGAPFYNPPQPTSFFTNRGGSIGPQSLGQYVAYAMPAAIPYSIVDGIVGFRIESAPGAFNYGYVQVGGGLLRGFRFETEAGVAAAIAGIPEPASWALLIAGFGLTGATLRRRRAALA